MKAIQLKLGLLAATCALAAQSTIAADGQRKDFQIALDACSTITDYDQYGIFDDVTVSVREGVATLIGKVTLPSKRHDIEKRVARVSGVASVRNQIEVLPVSKLDEELRVKIANAIYQNSNFWAYSTLPKPPIHIIVEGSRVTLAGIVHTDIDRRLAQSLAMQGGAGQVTNSLKTDAEAREAFER